MNELQTEINELKEFILDLKADRAATKEKEKRESWTKYVSLTIVIIAVIAAIAYQVGNDAATLLVSDRHSLFRWNRDYSIAWSGMKDNPGACNQCHLDARSQL